MASHDDELRVTIGAREIYDQLLATSAVVRSTAQDVKTLTHTVERHEHARKELESELDAQKALHMADMQSVRGEMTSMKIRVYGTIGGVAAAGALLLRVVVG